MHLAELKAKSPSDLLTLAEELEVENASSLRKQDMMFAILKAFAENDQAIHGDGTLEILPDGFGFLRNPGANYLPGPDDIYVSPAQVRRFSLRTGDTVDGEIRAPKDGERYFSLVRVDKINFEAPDAVKHRINFDNLTPLYPTSRLKMEVEVPVLPALPPAAAREENLLYDPTTKTLQAKSLNKDTSKNTLPKDNTARVIDLIAPIGKGQ